jgi:hypothetical protein
MMMGTAKDHNWKAHELPITDVWIHKDLQLRVHGVDPSHLRTLPNRGDGRDLEPIKVAKIEKAHYAVNGHHSLEAYLAAGRKSISVLVARMCFAEAKDEALDANTKHGEALTRADKLNRLNTHIDRGKHLDAVGRTKSCRVIAAELGNLWGHETIRKHLKRREDVKIDEDVECGAPLAQEHEEASDTEIRRGTRRGGLRGPGGL